MRRTTIKPKRLYQLAQEYMSSRPILLPNSKGGRPRIYDDALILTIVSVQNLNQYSFREVLEYCEDYFSDLPVLSTYHDRLSQFSSDIAQGFIEYIGKTIRLLSKKNKLSTDRIFIIDGTGFSYHDVYPMKLFKGKEIRKIQTHLKVAALIGLIGKKRYIISANAGPPYSGETTLVQPLLEQMPKSSYGYVLGDKAYDSLRIMTTVSKKGYQPVIPAKQGRFCTIKDRLRKQSNQNAQNHDIYKQRTLIEGLFGNIKQKLSSHVRIFKLEIAQTFALLRFALLNISVLLYLEKAILWLLWFPNSARKAY